jgi:HAD superfamily phosphoserine phosphatase-like hydrolase
MHSGNYKMMIIASDLEGTLTTGETWRGVKAYLEQHHRKADFWLFFLTQFPQYLSSKLGLISKREFQNRWTAHIMRLFAGLTIEEFKAVATWVAEHELLPKVRRSVLQELEAAKQNGSRVILASGTYQPVLEAFAARFGFEALGTPIAVQNGKLTGLVLGEIRVGLEKRLGLEKYLAGQILDVAYGDTMPDIPMLELAGEAIVASGDSALEAEAQKRGWRVISS